MSYDVQIFRAETKVKEQQSGNNDFFDSVDNLVPFTNEQFQELKNRLSDYDYELTKEDQAGLNFSNEEFGILALLTRRGLYFQTSGDEDDIFEMGMTASEFTDSGAFAKYDPQADGWEEE